MRPKEDKKTSDDGLHIFRSKDDKIQMTLQNCGWIKPKLHNAEAC